MEGGINTRSTLTGSATYSPKMAGNYISLNFLTGGLFHQMSTKRLQGITVEVTWLPPPTNAAGKSLLEIRLFWYTHAGTTLETNVTNSLCMSNMRLTLLKTIYEADTHIQPLHHPIRLLTSCYFQIAVPVDFTTAAARSVNVNLGVLFARAENIQRLLLFYSDHLDADGAMLYAHTGQPIIPVSTAWSSDSRLVPTGDTEGYRVFRNGKCVADTRTHGTADGAQITR